MLKQWVYYDADGTRVLSMLMQPVKAATKESAEQWEKILKEVFNV